MAEIELPMDGVGPTSPPLTVADVTQDDRFSGDRLASLTRPEAEDLLKMVATMTRVPRPE
jgi:hypothetical protein